MKPTICKPANAQQTGPNRFKMIFPECRLNGYKFTPTRAILETKTAQDIFAKQYEARNIIKLLKK